MVTSTPGVKAVWMLRLIHPVKPSNNSTNTCSFNFIYKQLRTLGWYPTLFGLDKFCNVLKTWHDISDFFSFFFLLLLTLKLAHIEYSRWRCQIILIISNLKFIISAFRTVFGECDNSCSRIPCAVTRIKSTVIFFTTSIHIDLITFPWNRRVLLIT